MPKTGEILPKETHQVTDLEAMEEGAANRTPTEGTRGNQAHLQDTSAREHDTEGAQSKGQGSPRESLQGDSATTIP